MSLTCPLTPLEKSLRTSAGEAGYEGGFVEHYLVGLIYPGGIDATMRSLLVAVVAAAIVLAYRPLLVRSPGRSSTA